MPQVGDSLTFNVDDGGLEAQVHGCRAKLLRAADYSALGQCTTVDDMKAYLSVQTDYDKFLAQEPSPLTAKVLKDKAVEKFVAEFNEYRFNASYPLSQFLDFITYQYMIDNVLKLIMGIKNKASLIDVLQKRHPLGLFETFDALAAVDSVKQMYNLVLIDSPIAPYFNGVELQDLNDYSTAFIREILQKNYLESFYDFCEELGGPCFETMQPILEFEADRQVIMITKQSLASQNMGDLSKENRKKLYPNIGQLVDLQSQLAEVDTEEDLKKALSPIPEYAKMIDTIMNNKTIMLDNLLQKRAIEHYKDSFVRQFQYGMFYGIVKLKEQECKNLEWIAECIKTKQMSRVSEIFYTY